MATTIGRFSVNFGLVALPVLVSAATEPRSSGLHYVHAADGARVRQRWVSSADGSEVAWDQIARGYQAPDGRVVILTSEDLADLPLPVASKAIEVMGFVPESDVDALLYDKAYYLAADGPGAGRAYRLLREALVESGLVGVARWALRTRESLALLRVRQDVLVVHSLLWPEEVRSTEGLAPDSAPAPSQRERDMARTLLEQLTVSFEWSEHRDEYRRALEAVVSAKLEDAEPPHAPAARVMPAEVVDLMAVLEASVASARASREAGEDPGDGERG